jgi:hypothetical protein
VQLFKDDMVMNGPILHVTSWMTARRVHASPLLLPVCYIFDAIMTMPAGYQLSQQLMMGGHYNLVVAGEFYSLKIKVHLSSFAKLPF